MRGNFNKRLVAGAGITLLLLSIFFIGSSFKEGPDHSLRSKQVNLLIRQVGHQLLLRSGDLSSRILPVAETKPGRFLLKLEKEFTFNHDSLLFLSRRLLPKTEFPSGYTVTVHDCKKGEIIYGFQINNSTPDILACSGRSQPTGCYSIEFDFPDLYGNTYDKESRQLAAITNTPSTSGEIKAISPEELQSVNIEVQKVNPKTEKSGTDAWGFSLMNIVYGMLLLLGIGLLAWRFRKSVKREPAPAPKDDTIDEPADELPALGKFLFNIKEQQLLLGTEVTDLTDKECKVLELLHKNFGELISRDTLMQEVWINEGVITGRSLDMFVSKLRKKLSSDPELRITNVHGKGYKLEAVTSEVV
jgi:hypothetical protein